MTAKTAVALRTVVVLRTRSMMAVVAVWKGVARFVVRSRTVKPSGWWRVMVVIACPLPVVALNFPVTRIGRTPTVLILSVHKDTRDNRLRLGVRAHDAARWTASHQKRDA